MKQIGIWGGVVAITIAIVWGLIALVNSNNPNVLSSQTINLPPVSKDDLVSGDPQKAKVTLVEYADFQCPACANYASLVRTLEKDFGDKLLVVYRFFPLTQIHKTAMLSSQAAYAANKQGKFWEMSELLYENQSSWADQSSAQDIFISYAKKLNLNISEFTTDLNSDATKKTISDAESSAISIGINATPTFFVNGTEIQNPPGYAAFKQIIQDELNKK